MASHCASQLKFKIVTKTPFALLFSSKAQLISWGSTLKKPWQGGGAILSLNDETVQGGTIVRNFCTT